MDTFNIVYYGLICGALGLSSPWLGRKVVRFGVGIVVGIVGAAILPLLRSMMTTGY